MDVRRGLLGHAQPLLVVGDAPVGVDARLHADLGGPEGHRLGHAAAKLLLAVLVGVGRTLALPEAAEGTAHHAHVRHVDVAVDHERHPLAGQLAAQLVGHLAHVLDRLRPRFAEQRGELLRAERRAIAGARYGPRDELGPPRPLLAPSRAAARDEAPVLQLDHVEHALLQPAGVHVLRVHAQPLGERVSGRGQLLAHPVHRREGMLGRDVVAVGRQPAQVGGALVHQRQPPVGQVGRDLDPHPGQQPPALPHQHAHVLEADRRGPARQRKLAGRRALAALGLVGDRRRLGAVVTLVGHEVLQDQLLQVAVLGLHLGQGLQRGHAVLGRLADPHQDPAGERDGELPGGPDRLQPHLRVLGRRALMDHQIAAHRLQHQPLRGGDLAQPGQLVARAHPHVGVRQHPPLQRPLAGPGHIRDEVLVAVAGQPRRHLGVDLRLLTGQHQQLLGAATGGVVQQGLHLVRRVQVRPVRRERAVLAVAPAGPRQGEREVPRKRDPPHPVGV